MIRHPDDRMIERFVEGALDDDEGDAFVAHVAGCDACSAKLQREAVLELALMDVQKRRTDAVAKEADEASMVAAAKELAAVRPLGAAKAPSRRKVERRSILPALAFAAAAAAVVYVGRDLTSAKHSAELRPVAVCPDGPKQAECIAEARRAGRSLEYPQRIAASAGNGVPGLEVEIEAMTPALSIPAVEATMATLRPVLTKCLENGLSVQTAPTMTGEFAIEAEIGPSGDPWTPGLRWFTTDSTDAGSADVVPDYLRQTIPCAMAAVQKAHFSLNGTPTRLEITVKFVWRE
jgi:hypothetical protein